jgi:hypothetical protein
MAVAMPGSNRRAGGIRELKKELAVRADPDRARKLAWFFKTAKGQCLRIPATSGNAE